MSHEFQDAYDDLFDNAIRRLKKAWMMKLEAIQACQDTIKQK
jgi:hypothetical protein